MGFLVNGGCVTSRDALAVHFWKRLQKERTMNRERSCRATVLVGLGLACGLLVLASLVHAQSSIHKNGFESKLGWTKGGFDAVYEEVAQKLDEREPHNGQRSEFIELNVKQGKFIHYVYPVNKAPITQELRASMWVRANRPGIELTARVVLPNERDPNNLDYRLTTYIKGDTFNLVGRWQLMEIRRPVEKWKDQQQRMSANSKRTLDFTGAYIDALILNLNAGPGPTKVWIDDLEIGPVAPSATIQPAVRPDNNNPAKTTSAPRVPSRTNPVSFNGNRLMAGDKRVLFRAVRYSDTTLPVLRNAGFNTIFFNRNANPSLLNDAAEQGMWIVPEFSITNDEGVALSAEDIAKQTQRFSENDSVIFQNISGTLNFPQASMVSKAIPIARQAAPSHPIGGSVEDGLVPYSRTLNVLGVHRYPLMTTLELPKYREFLDSQRKLANPGVFMWTMIQTHLPESFSEVLYNQPAQAAFREPVGPQPEQIRLLTYNALASGCRGIGFSSDRFLADSHQGRDRLLACALLNQEIEMLEPLLVTIEDAPVWIDTSNPDIKAAVLRCNQGVVVMPIWQGKFSQFVPGQAATSKLAITVPQVPITAQAWEVSPGEVRGLKMERVDRGQRITLPEFGLTSVIVFSSDTNLMGRFQDQARAKRQQAAQWSYDMALYEFEKVTKVEAELLQVGSTVNEGNLLVEDARRRLQKSKELLDSNSFSEAYHEAQRALRPLRILMRLQWEKAARGLDSPVTSPYSVSYYTLPKHWPFMDQVRRSTVGNNLLRGGDFELPPDRKQESWGLTRPNVDALELIAERLTELQHAKPGGNGALDAPMEGKQCAMLQIRPRGGRAAPAAIEKVHMTLTSPTLRLPPGTLVQVSGWVNIPAPITASPDGALIYDSAGGEQLAIRLTDATPWKKITVYRRVPASGTINVTIAMTGIGTIYFDDMRVEPLVPPNGVAFDNNGQR